MFHSLDGNDARSVTALRVRRLPILFRVWPHGSGRISKNCRTRCRSRHRRSRRLFSSRCSNSNNYLQTIVSQCGRLNIIFMARLSSLFVSYEIITRHEHNIAMITISRYAAYLAKMQYKLIFEYHRSDEKKYNFISLLKYFV